jgi:hypothetical protein
MLAEFFATTFACSNAVKLKSHEQDHNHIRNLDLSRAVHCARHRGNRGGFGDRIDRSPAPLIDLTTDKRGQTTMLHVYINEISAAITPHGEIGATIRAKRNPAFTGNPDDCVQYLQALGIGHSVEVRWMRDDGSWSRIRSCMNKPALWADMLADAE